LYVTTTENNIPVAHKKYVKIGKTFNRETEITQGLKPGDTVITQGYNNVSNGSLLNIKK
jgi:multidrug efflux pump subunit AcrA (membrane-fusion protein)